MAGRLTQSVVEVLRASSTNTGRLTQSTVEVARASATNTGRLSQLVSELLSETPPGSVSVSSQGDIGSGQNKTNSTSISMTTSLAVATGELAVMIVATDDESTIDEESAIHASVTIDGNSMTKAKEYSNADGSTVSVWYWLATTDAASGVTVLSTFTTGRTAKAVTGFVFAPPEGVAVSVDGTATSAPDAAQPGSLSATGSYSDTHVWVRGISLEESHTTLGSLTNTPGWQAITGNGTTGGGGNTNQSVRAEYKIGAGEHSGASNPTLSAVSDSASVLVGLRVSIATEEVIPLVTGWLVDCKLIGGILVN